MPRHHTRIKNLARRKAAAEQTPYKAARRALLGARPAAPAARERFSAPDPLAAALRARPVIGVVSAAGGTGVSVLAANLAIALADSGHRVLVLDTEHVNYSPWREDAAVIRALGGGRISTVQVSFEPYLPIASPWDETDQEGWSDDDSRWDLPDLVPQLDPDAVPQLVGDGGRLLPLDPGLVAANDTVVIDASKLAAPNFAGDLLAAYAGALVTPLQLRIDQLAPDEDDWDGDEDWDGDDEGEDDLEEVEYDAEPRLGQPYPASEVVDTLLRSRFTAPPAHLPGTGLAVVEPPAHDGFRLDPDFPAEFDRLMAQAGVPVLGPWIPRLARPRQEQTLALAAPGGRAATAYERLAAALRATAA